MTATADLRSEHGGVARMLRIMDRTAHAAMEGTALDADDLEKIVEFLRVFVDKCHHSKEEELLFPALRAQGVEAVEGAVVRLLDEHVRGRDTVARLAAMVEALRREEPAENRAIAEVMSEYTSLLRAHIRFEESDCFDIADARLPAEVQQALEAGYDRIEKEVVGGGVHEAFHALLDRLEQKAHS